MTDQILQGLGLGVICFGVWRFVVLLLDDITSRWDMRDVMEGRAEPPWEPTTVRVISEPFDQEHDIR